MRRIAVVLVSALLLAGLMVRGQETPPNVVATFSVVGDLVRAVAGDTIDLTVLVGPDSDSHVYEPTPQDAIALTDAAIIFENGLEFEAWLDELVETSGSSAPRIAVSDGIEPLEFVEGEHHDEHEGDDHADEATAEPMAAEATEEPGHEDEHADDEHADEHEHGEYDPHIWHAPNNVVIMVENIRAALTAQFPANADLYAANAAALTADFTALDAYIREQVVSIPEANRVLITSHDTFGYFADEYGFAVETILGSITTEAADPGAGELAELISEIQADGVPAIFAENVANPDLLERVATEAGVVVAPTLYTDALGAPGTPGETLAGMLRYNIDTIVQALR